MKNLFLIIILFLFSIVSLNSFSQERWDLMRNEICGGILGTQLLGDVGGKNGIGTNDIRDFNFQSERIGISAGFSHRASKRIIIETKLSFAYLHGSDLYTKEPYRNNRNITIRVPLAELSVQGEYIIWSKKKLGHLYTIRGIQAKSIIDYYIYILAGVGGFWFDPYGQDLRPNGDHKWYRLKPLRTEGEGLVPTRKQYSNYQVCIPLGIGIKFALTKHYSIGVECSYRKTFTDYLDDVSTTYFDPNAIRKAAGGNGDLAVYFANPSPTSNTITPNKDGISETSTAPGIQRGDPRNKDGYMFLLVALYYKLPQKGFMLPRF